MVQIGPAADGSSLKQPCVSVLSQPLLFQSPHRRARPADTSSKTRTAHRAILPEGCSDELCDLAGDVGPRTLIPEDAQLLCLVDPLACQKAFEDASAPEPIWPVRNVCILATYRLRIGAVLRRRRRQNRQVKIEQECEVRIVDRWWALPVSGGEDIALHFGDQLIRKTQWSQALACQISAGVLVVMPSRVVDNIMKEDR